jgi:hypothetical protein
MPDLLVATEDFCGELPNSGKEFVGRAGKTTVRPDSAAAKAWPQMFKAYEPPAQDTSQMLVAAQSFVGELDGQDFVARQGITRVRADSAAARKWPKMFRTMDSTYPDVEQATAAPGERRA